MVSNSPAFFLWGFLRLGVFLHGKSVVFSQWPALWYMLLFFCLPVTSFLHPFKSTVVADWPLIALGFLIIFCGFNICPTHSFWNNLFVNKTSPHYILLSVSSISFQYLIIFYYHYYCFSWGVCACWGRWGKTGRLCTHKKAVFCLKIADSLKSSSRGWSTLGLKESVKRREVKLEYL